MMIPDKCKYKVFDDLRNKHYYTGVVKTDKSGIRLSLGDIHRVAIDSRMLHGGKFIGFEQGGVIPAEYPLKVAEKILTAEMWRSEDPEFMGLKPREEIDSDGVWSIFRLVTSESWLIGWFYGPKKCKPLPFFYKAGAGDYEWIKKKELGEEAIQSIQPKKAPADLGPLWDFAKDSQKFHAGGEYTPNPSPSVHQDHYIALDLKAVVSAVVEGAVPGQKIMDIAHLLSMAGVGVDYDPASMAYVFYRGDEEPIKVSADAMSISYSQMKELLVHVGAMPKKDAGKLYSAWIDAKISEKGGVQKVLDAGFKIKKDSPQAYHISWPSGSCYSPYLHVEKPIENQVESNPFTTMPSVLPDNGPEEAIHAFLHDIFYGTKSTAKTVLTAITKGAKYTVTRVGDFFVFSAPTGGLYCLPVELVEAQKPGFSDLLSKPPLFITGARVKQLMDNGYSPAKAMARSLRELGKDHILPKYTHVIDKLTGEKCSVFQIMDAMTEVISDQGW